MNVQKPQIPSLVAAGLSGLNQLLVALAACGLPSTVATVESHLSRFKLWAGSLGAHRISGTRSLEYRLRDASSIRKHLTSLLEDLRNLILTEALPLVQNEPIQVAEAALEEVEKDAADDELEAYFDDDEDEDDGTDDPSNLREKELKQVFLHIGGVIDCLLRLSVTISNPAPHDRFRSRAGAQVGYYEPWDIQHVREKFPHVDEEIAERLGRALTHRRKYFKYRENHYCRLKEGLEGDDDGMSKGRATTVASSVPQQLKDTDAQSLGLFDADRSEISQTVYAPSIINKSQLQVPPIPKEHIDGPFLCPFCYVFISVDSRHEWKRHVFRDLRPYICLSKTCVAADQDFQRRKDWSRHMFDEHWRKWACPFGCAGSLTSSSDFRQHLTKIHGTDISEEKLRSFVPLASQANLTQSEGMCPLCHKFEIKANRRAHSYESHVGHHLEQLALFVLPFQDDDDDDDDNEESEDDDNNDSDGRETEGEEGDSPGPETTEEHATRLKRAARDHKDDNEDEDGDNRRTEEEEGGSIDSDSDQEHLDGIQTDREERERYRHRLTMSDLDYEHGYEGRGRSPPLPKSSESHERPESNTQNTRSRSEFSRVRKVDPDDHRTSDDGPQELDPPRKLIDRSLTALIGGELKGPMEAVQNLHRDDVYGALHDHEQLGLDSRPSVIRRSKGRLGRRRNESDHIDRRIVPDRHTNTATMSTKDPGHDASTPPEHNDGFNSDDDIYVRRTIVHSNSEITDTTNTLLTEDPEQDEAPAPEDKGNLAHRILSPGMLMYLAGAGQDNNPRHDEQQ